MVFKLQWETLWLAPQLCDLSTECLGWMAQFCANYSLVQWNWFSDVTDACNSGASSDHGEPISLHQAVNGIFTKAPLDYQSTDNFKSMWACKSWCQASVQVALKRMPTGSTVENQFLCSNRKLTPARIIPSNQTPSFFFFVWSSCQFLSIFVLRKKGSETKNRIKEEEIEKGDCGPPTRKISSYPCRRRKLRKEFDQLLCVLHAVCKGCDTIICQLHWKTHTVHMAVTHAQSSNFIITCMTINVTALWHHYN